MPNLNSLLADIENSANTINSTVPTNSEYQKIRTNFGFKKDKPDQNISDNLTDFAGSLLYNVADGATFGALSFVNNKFGNNPYDVMDEDLSQAEKYGAWIGQGLSMFIGGAAISAGIRGASKIFQASKIASRAIEGSSALAKFGYSSDEVANVVSKVWKNKYNEISGLIKGGAHSKDAMRIGLKADLETSFKSLALKANGSKGLSVGQKAIINELSDDAIMGLTEHGVKLNSLGKYLSGKVVKKFGNDTKLARFAEKTVDAWGDHMVVFSLFEGLGGGMGALRNNADAYKKIMGSKYHGEVEFNPIEIVMHSALMSLGMTAVGAIPGGGVKSLFGGILERFKFPKQLINKEGLEALSDDALSAYAKTVRTYAKNAKVNLEYDSLGITDAAITKGVVEKGMTRNQAIDLVTKFRKEGLETWGRYQNTEIVKDMFASLPRQVLGGLLFGQDLFHIKDIPESEVGGVVINALFGALMSKRKHSLSGSKNTDILTDFYSASSKHRDMLSSIRKDFAEKIKDKDGNVIKEDGKEITLIELLEESTDYNSMIKDHSLLKSNIATFIDKEMQSAEGYRDEMSRINNFISKIKPEDNRETEMFFHLAQSNDPKGLEDFHYSLEKRGKTELSETLKGVEDIVVEGSKIQADNVPLAKVLAKITLHKAHSMLGDMDPEVVFDATRNRLFNSLSNYLYSRNQDKLNKLEIFPIEGKDGKKYVTIGDFKQNFSLLETVLASETLNSIENRSYSYLQEFANVFGMTIETPVESGGRVKIPRIPESLKLREMKEGYNFADAFNIYDAVARELISTGRAEWDNTRSFKADKEQYIKEQNTLETISDNFSKELAAELGYEHDNSLEVPLGVQEMARQRSILRDYTKYQLLTGEKTGNITDEVFDILGKKYSGDLMQEGMSLQLRNLSDSFRDSKGDFVVNTENFTVDGKELTDSQSLILRYLIEMQRSSGSISESSSQSKKNLNKVDMARLELIADALSGNKPIDEAMIEEGSLRMKRVLAEAYNFSPTQKSFINETDTHSQPKVLPSEELYNEVKYENSNEIHTTPDKNISILIDNVNAMPDNLGRIAHGKEELKSYYETHYETKLSDQDFKKRLIDNVESLSTNVHGELDNIKTDLRKMLIEAFSSGKKELLAEDAADSYQSEKHADEMLQTQKRFDKALHGITDKILALLGYAENPAYKRGIVKNYNDLMKQLIGEKKGGGLEVLTELLTDLTDIDTFRTNIKKVEDFYKLLDTQTKIYRDDHAVTNTSNVETGLRDFLDRTGESSHSVSEASLVTKYPEMFRGEDGNFDPQMREVMNSLMEDTIAGIEQSSIQFDRFLKSKLSKSSLTREEQASALDNFYSEELPQMLMIASNGVKVTSYTLYNEVLYKQDMDVSKNSLHNKVVQEADKHNIEIGVINNQMFENSRELLDLKTDDFAEKERIIRTLFRTLPESDILSKELDVLREMEDGDKRNTLLEARINEAPLYRTMFQISANTILSWKAKTEADALSYLREQLSDLKNLLKGRPNQSENILGGKHKRIIEAIEKGDLKGAFGTDNFELYDFIRLNILLKHSNAASILASYDDVQGQGYIDHFIKSQKYMSQTEGTSSKIFGSKLRIVLDSMARNLKDFPEKYKMDSYDAFRYKEGKLNVQSFDDEVANGAFSVDKIIKHHAATRLLGNAQDMANAQKAVETFLKTVNPELSGIDGATYISRWMRDQIEIFFNANKDYGDAKGVMHLNDIGEGRFATIINKTALIYDPKVFDGGKDSNGKDVDILAPRSAMKIFEGTLSDGTPLTEMSGMDKVDFKNQKTSIMDIVGRNISNSLPMETLKLGFIVHDPNGGHMSHSFGLLKDIKYQESLFRAITPEQLIEATRQVLESIKGTWNSGVGDVLLKQWKADGNNVASSSLATHVALLQNGMNPADPVLASGLERLIFDRALSNLTRPSNPKMSVANLKPDLTLRTPVLRHMPEGKSFVQFIGEGTLPEKSRDVVVDKDNELSFIVRGKAKGDRDSDGNSLEDRDFIIINNPDKPGQWIAKDSSGRTVDPKGMRDVDGHFFNIQEMFSNIIRDSKKVTAGASYTLGNVHDLLFALKSKSKTLAKLDISLNSITYRIPSQSVSDKLPMRLRNFEVGNKMSINSHDIVGLHQGDFDIDKAWSIPLLDPTMTRGIINDMNIVTDSPTLGVSGTTLSNMIGFGDREKDRGLDGIAQYNRNIEKGAPGVGILQRTYASLGTLINSGFDFNGSINKILTGDRAKWNGEGFFSQMTTNVSVMIDRLKGSNVLTEFTPTELLDFVLFGDGRERLIGTDSGVDAKTQEVLNNSNSFFIVNKKGLNPVEKESIREVVKLFGQPYRLVSGYFDTVSSRSKKFDRHEISRLNSKFREFKKDPSLFIMKKLLINNHYSNLSPDQKAIQRGKIYDTYIDENISTAKIDSQIASLIFGKSVKDKKAIKFKKDVLKIDVNKISKSSTAHMLLDRLGRSFPPEQWQSEHGKSGSYSEDNVFNLVRKTELLASLGMQYDTKGGKKSISLADLLDAENFNGKGDKHVATLRLSEKALIAKDMIDTYKSDLENSLAYFADEGALNQSKRIMRNIEHADYLLDVAEREYGFALKSDLLLDPENKHKKSWKAHYSKTQYADRDFTLYSLAPFKGAKIEEKYIKKGTPYSVKKNSYYLVNEKLSMKKTTRDNNQALAYEIALNKTINPNMIFPSNIIRSTQFEIADLYKVVLEDMKKPKIAADIFKTKIKDKLEALIKDYQEQKDIVAYFQGNENSSLLNLLKPIEKKYYIQVGGEVFRGPEIMTNVNRQVYRYMNDKGLLQNPEIKSYIEDFAKENRILNNESLPSDITISTEPIRMKSASDFRRHEIEMFLNSSLSPINHLGVLKKTKTWIIDTAKKRKMDARGRC